jgi:hypothetical protein
MLSISFFRSSLSIVTFQVYSELDHAYLRTCIVVLLSVVMFFFSCSLNKRTRVHYADRLAEAAARATSHSVALACAGNGISECRFCAGRIGLWQISQLTSTCALPAAVSKRCCSTPSVPSTFVVAFGVADTGSP